VDAVVHAAAPHGIHLEKFTSDDFWDLNVTGTRNVYEAELGSGIDKILLCSTMGVYGEGADEAGDPPVITEDLPLEPKDYYGFSKRLREEIRRQRCGPSVPARDRRREHNLRRLQHHGRGAVLHRGVRRVEPEGFLEARCPGVAKLPEEQGHTSGNRFGCGGSPTGRSRRPSAC
jgi:NAD dependent epimerase/dehydratase family